MSDPTSKSPFPVRPRRGQRDRANTEDRIVAAASAIFAEIGLQRATVRKIAERAEVNPASVIKFFGTKEQLFARVTAFDELVQLNIRDATRGDLHTFVTTSMGVWDDPRSEPFRALFRSAMTHPESAVAFRQALMDGYIADLATTIEAPDADRRAAVVSAMMLGLAMTRSVFELEALADVDAVAETVRAALAVLLAEPSV